MRKDRRWLVFAAGAVSVAWIGVLFYFSGQSGADSGNLSRKLTQRLFGWLIEMGGDAARIEHVLRKLAHGGIFAVEGFLMGLTALLCTRRLWPRIAAMALCVVLAVCNELHQTMSAGRSCSPADMLIDAGGALAGLAAVSVILHVFRTQYEYDR